MSGTWDEYMSRPDVQAERALLDEAIELEHVYDRATSRSERRELRERIEVKMVEYHAKQNERIRRGG